MNRNDLSAKQIEALEKISAAGESGLPRKVGARVTVNGHCIRALWILGLIQSERSPYLLTEAGKVAISGEEFEASRHVRFQCARGGGFNVAPTFNSAQALVEWKALPEDARHLLDSRREDDFRRYFPGIAIRGDD